MKKFFSKVKKGTKDFFTNKSAFSLVELIVVIAIMAVMAAVLAPALLGYVERSRSQKDDSAMGEVTNAIKLSLADQNVYDELLPYAVKGNFSCYADGDTSTNTDANKTITKAPDYWLFTDEAHKLDETPYKPAGSMRGATVTFKPNGSAEYILKDGIVNQIGDESTKKGTNGGAVLEDCPELYNRLRSTVGDTIKVSSQTYRNSTYTIFISMGTTGGNQADKQDAIQVYGQYNGTNLPEVMTATGSASQDKGNAGSEQPGGGAPVVTLPAKGKTLAEYTWSEVQQIIQAGKATEYNFKVGDLTRTFTINDNAGKQARIVDIDNNNKVTFMLTSNIGNHRMTAPSTDYPYGDNINGYTDTEMKAWLDTTVYNGLDADLKAVISPTTITCADGYNSPNGTKSATCYLFLPSIKEVGLNDDISGWYSYMTAIEAEGETFDYFAEGGYIDDWLRLRSPDSYLENVFFGYYYGSNDDNIAYGSYPVYPAFVIS